VGYLKTFLTLEGRLSPLQYWRLQVRLSWAAAIVFALTAFATIVGGWLGAVPFVLVIPIIASGACIGVRRLHDRGKHGVWLILFTLGPIALIAPTQFVKSEAAPGLMLGAILLALVGFGVWLWGWIEIGLLAGPRSPNRYGPDPRAPA
jgi:uncharacterized membrane protein YhaH (DUF805 family)